MLEDHEQANAETSAGTGVDEAPTSGTSATAGSFAGFRALVGIVAFPQTSFRIIRERRPWVAALAVILAILALRTVLGQRDLAAIVGNGESAVNLYGPGMTMAAAVLISLPIEALLVWRLSLAFGAKLRFLALFSLMVHVYVVGRLGNLFSYLLSKGRQALEPPEASSSFELDFSNPAVHTTVGALLEGGASIAVSLWTLILLGLGIGVAARVSKWTGLGIAGLYAAVIAALGEGLERMTSVFVQSIR
ncbi:MAG: hypothetical protein OXG83_10270 [Acidobacteria bacterium]|nr:hypothetical protein [Acidobacteriota bacterium]